MLSYASSSFYAVGSIVPPTRRVNISISCMAHNRSNQLERLFTVHKHCFFRTPTLSTRRLPSPIANVEADIPNIEHGACPPLSLSTMSTYQRSSSTWLSFHTVLPPLTYLGFSHKPAASKRDQYHLTSVAYPTTYATGKLLATTRHRRHTINATQD